MALTNNNGFAPPFASVGPGPFAHMATVTPSDTAVGFGSTKSFTRGLYTHSGGTIAMVLAGDNITAVGDAVTITVPANTWLNVCAKQVLATGTSIGDLTAFW